MTPRLRPAKRRAHETIAVQHEEQRFKIGLGRELICAEAARLGPVVEVFINAQKVNSPLDVLASDGAILMSLLIQYGHPIEEIARSMKRNPDGTPASILGLAAAEILRATEEGGT
ncbi:hypothetical protein [Bradyrhizobium sp. SZCCHNR2032]|uniref:hypothetical protein n=1 Tax=Bradyrhizobium sp. SZCCHNR2032 TaxID=3057384 RepID=UPI002916DC4C|nr:hypothetical protein [Bradyrhizobium sp. SZCCHNR2032]